MKRQESGRVFGINPKRGGWQSFVVLDKSYLQGVRADDLQFRVQQGWIFGIPDVLWYEHFRKWDRRRWANLKKLKSIEKSLLLLPGIGEMFRAEADQIRPAPQVMEPREVKFEAVLDSKEFFDLDVETLKVVEERTAELEERLDQMVEVWMDFKRIPEFENAKSEDMPEIVEAKSIQIRDDREDMRGFYRRHRHRSFPKPELIDERWTFFRWIQVQLLAGLDFYASHGLGAPFNREKMFHEILDLDYLIPALLVGGLACRETTIVDRFNLLRTGGFVLK